MCSAKTGTSTSNDENTGVRVDDTGSDQQQQQQQDHSLTGAASGLFTSAHGHERFMCHFSCGFFMHHMVCRAGRVAGQAWR